MNWHFPSLVGGGVIPIGHRLHFLRDTGVWCIQGEPRLTSVSGHSSFMGNDRLNPYVCVLASVRIATKKTPVYAKWQILILILMKTYNYIWKKA